MEDKISVLIPQEELETRIREMAAQISKDYEGKKLHLVCILRGSIFFTCELAKYITVPVTIDFMSVSSYGSGTTTSGSLTIVKDLTVDVSGRDVIIVEDIVDTGTTLARLKEMLLARNANSVAIATLLNKPSRRKVEVEVNYFGFEIPDEFVVGFGLDFDEKYRTLKDVCVLKEEAYM